MEGSGEALEQPSSTQREPIRKLERLFAQGHVVTRGNDFKLAEGRFRLYIRKKFFTVYEAVKHWNRMAREGVDAPSLEVTKARLDGVLKNQF